MELKGLKWEELTVEQQENLLSQANVDSDNWDRESGECLIDFACGLSIGGIKRETNEEYIITPHADESLYDSIEGIL